MAKDSLLKFSNAIISEAEEHKRQHIAKLKEENRILTESKKAELEKIKQEYIQTETQKAESLKNFRLSVHQCNLKAELIKKRDTLYCNMFEKVKEKLLEYSKSERYYQSLKRDYLDTLGSFRENNVVICAKSVDIEFLKTLSNPKITFEEAENNIIGGFTLLCREKRFFMDYTLMKKLEEEKKNFILNSGFLI